MLAKVATKKKPPFSMLKNFQDFGFRPPSAPSAVVASAVSCCYLMPFQNQMIIQHPPLRNPTVQDHLSESFLAFLFSRFYFQKKTFLAQASWWFFPTHLKNMIVKLDHFPKVRKEFQKYLSCHHLVSNFQLLMEEILHQLI